MNRLVAGIIGVVLGTGACAPLPHAVAPYGVAWGGDTACQAPTHRAFDFWLGSWTVHDTGGRPLATSVIRSVLAGCALVEDYIGRGGFQGRSLTAYDRAGRRWIQAFADNMQGTVRLTGAPNGQGIVLSGTQRILRQGQIVTRDLTVQWTPGADGSVRQVLLASFDGAPPITTFDGRYRPAATLDRTIPRAYPFCRDSLPGFRALDFWQGEWMVRDGVRVLGRAVITPSLNDCALEERFVGPDGYEAYSLLIHDWIAERWYRLFADNRGTVCWVDGPAGEGVLDLRGERTDRHGARQAVRVRITRQPDSTVRQIWSVFDDRGASWRDDLTLMFGRERP